MRRISKKRQQKLNEEKKERIKMKLFFFYCWDKWDKVSEVSGERIYGESSTIYHHHVLPKSSHPELKYLPYNIVNLTWDEHTKCDNDADCFPLISSRRREILRNYEHYVSLAKEFEEDILEPLYEKSKHLFDGQSPS